MRLVSYRHRGSEGFGAVCGDGAELLELGGRFGPEVTSLRALLAHLPPERLVDAVGRALAEGGSRLPLAEVAFLPVIPAPGKIIGAGLNYADHAAEVPMQQHARPTLFLRVPESQSGHMAPMVQPRESRQLDFEAELAVVIGRGGRRIPEAQALDHVAGFSCYNDGSVRDWQAHTSQVIAGKNFPATGAFGPWLVTRDELPDPSDLAIRCRIDGEVMQDSRTSRMIHTVPALIAYISSFLALQPGDVIATGTPGGVGLGRSPQRFLQPGETVEVEIEGIGVLRNPVVAEG